MIDLKFELCTIEQIFSVLDANFLCRIVVMVVMICPCVFSKEFYFSVSNIAHLAHYAPERAIQLVLLVPSCCWCVAACTQSINVLFCRSCLCCLKALNGAMLLHFNSSHCHCHCCVTHRETN